VKPRICVDIDNVIAQTDQVIRRIIKLHSNQAVDLCYEDIADFDYWRCLDKSNRRIDKEEWERIHLEFTQNHLDEVQPFQNVAAHLATLADRFEIHLATSRLAAGAEHTRDWLARHQIPFDHLHFVSHRKKQEIPVVFAAAIDDDRDQAQLFYDSGVRAFLLAHPWNAVETGSPLIRVSGWPDLIAMLRTL
jgi:uncharacterized HAD superfamily protein